MLIIFFYVANCNLATMATPVEEYLKMVIFSIALSIFIFKKLLLNPIRYMKSFKDNSAFITFWKHNLFCFFRHKIDVRNLWWGIRFRRAFEVFIWFKHTTSTMKMLIVTNILWLTIKFWNKNSSFCIIFMAF